MKLMIQTAMIFFGTLMAAAVVALGEPAQADVALAGASSSAGALQQDSANLQLWLESASGKIGNSLR